MVSGRLNCSAVLEKATLQALRKLENCSLHLRFRCLCSLLHIWIRLQEEQSNCREKLLNCSAVLEKAALQALRKLQNCSLHMRFRCLCSLLHICIRLQEEQSNCREKLLNCSAVLEKAALQALRKLQNCSLHLRFRCLCSLLHICIRLQEEQSNCREKLLNCSALLEKAALQALRWPVPAHLCLQPLLLLACFYNAAAKQPALSFQQRQPSEAKLFPEVQVSQKASFPYCFAYARKQFFILS